MRDNSYDRTIERNYVQKWRFLIREYEEVKAGRSTAFGSVGAFYRHHGTCSQTFRKYYNRYLAEGGSEAALMPRRRGPTWKGRRLPAEIAELDAYIDERQTAFMMSSEANRRLSEIVFPQLARDYNKTFSKREACDFAARDMARDMLEHPTRLIDGVEACLDTIGDRYPIWVVTKGDLFDQESKLARSGLADRFARVEIVSEKDEATYARIAAAAGAEPERLMMVGNSVRSDIRPVVSLGGHGVHVPYPVTWAIEEAGLDDLPADRVHRLDRLAQLPALLERLEA